MSCLLPMEKPQPKTPQNTLNYINAYHNKRYKTDLLYKIYHDDKSREFMKNKYQNDPVYRAQKLEKCRLYREKKRQEQSCVKQSA